MSFISTLFDLFLRGGVFMIPLAIVAVAAVILMIERWLFLRENRIDGDRFHYELQEALKENDLDGAVVVAAKSKGIIGRSMEEGLLKIKAGKSDIIAATERVIHGEMSAMEKSRGWLVTFAQVAPLLGILGTVWGMIVAFMAIETSASTDPKLLAGGIYQALVTTLFGLLIAIPVMLYAEYLRKESNKILHYLDLFLIETRDWLEKRQEDAIHG